MSSLVQKRIVLGVSGGIAAYKAAELVRRLREGGAEVRVVMTRAACEFITPLTLQALSGQTVRTELLDPGQEAAMGHIELARWADVVLVAPASANFLARLAHGLADDLLAALCLAADVPVLVAPAMNQQMWRNAATQDNARLLAARGVALLGPAEGEQACGETGPGRMLEPAELAQLVERHFHTGLLGGLQVLVTAGPTREAIDPVRFISNRSSGRMGYAIACAACEAGAAVTLVSGPVSIDPPERVRCVPVRTADQMRAAVMHDVADADIFIAAAAVADYRCNAASQEKIKKQKTRLSLELERTPDILAEVAALPRPPFTVGFAAETESLEKHAREKLQDKGLDMIAANLVGAGLGMETEDNALEVYWPGGAASLERATKDKIARRLIHLVAERFHARGAERAH
ncbi:MAG: bifunctional phosphopantothenoylcysteine decarboxylase/phosphopantothenate--cysteine ligase CoaBC [Gammaproteobacteria bacterium]|nr:bifunctional phosphopantothenoylcysteine decarboxylase/phosphopantothenate--cysteine ligase CoaBC [Gammaproteobacteria bacterium]